MKNKFSFVVFSILLGFIGGIVGVIVSQNYILEKVLNIPLYGDIDIGQSGSGPSVIIRDAKNVVVEQNKKIDDTVNMVSSGIVGIFKKKNLTSAEKDLNVNILDEFYYKKNNFSDGYVVTSDGWIVTSFFDERLVVEDNKVISTSTIKLISDDYFVLLKNNDYYEISNIHVSTELGFVFIRIDKIDLPVRPFIDIDQVKNGELVVATSWDDWTWTTTVFSLSRNSSFIRSSDICVNEIVFNNPEQIKENSFVFNLNGELIAFVDSDKNIKLLDNFNSIIKTFTDKNLKRPAVLGVNYINLSSVVSLENDSMRGALLVSNAEKTAVLDNSPANLAGLVEGDILISVDGEDITANNDLNHIVSRYSVGDEVKVSGIRDGAELELLVKF